jgi:hypothetical protein
MANVFIGVDPHKLSATGEVERDRDDAGCEPAIRVGEMARRRQRMSTPDRHVRLNAGRAESRRYDARPGHRR